MATLHPEATGDAATLRWRVTPGPVAGTLDSDAGDALPGPLAALVADGTLARVTARPGAVTTTLGGGDAARDGWATAGGPVREALLEALEQRESWTEPAAGDATPRSSGTEAADAAIADSVRALLSGPVGVLAGSHGGRIELADVHDGIVDVVMHGACDGCPAAGNTLGRLVEGELRRRHPEIVEVRAVSGGCDRADAPPRRTLLTLLPTRGGRRG